MNERTYTQADVDELRDREHLRLLGFFHYVSAALSALICLVGVFYASILTFVQRAMQEAATAGGQVPAEFEQMSNVMGGVFLGVGTVIGCFGLTRVIFSAWAGWSLTHHRNKPVIYIASALDLLSIPYGALLAVFTFIVLSRRTVDGLFQRAGNPDATHLTPRRHID